MRREVSVWSVTGCCGVVRRGALVCVAGVIAGLAGGCMSAAEHRVEADETAGGIIESAQRAALGRSEAFGIERARETLRERLLIDQDLAVGSAGSVGTAYIERVQFWPDDAYLDDPGTERPLGAALPEGEGAWVLTLEEALAVAAKNSRAYQFQKEQVFLSALDLDLAREQFRFQGSAGAAATGIADLSASPEEAVGFVATPELSFSRNLENGATITGALGADIARLLTLDEGQSVSVFGDASISVPLLRGSGRHIVREPLTQAERDTIYAIFDFERFKREFVVDIVSDYLGVLQSIDQRENARRNYSSLIQAGRRLRRLAEEGRVPEVEVDQAVQDELQARNNWISARQGVERSLDNFRLTLGLPTDSRVVLDPAETEALVETVGRALGVVAGEDGEEGGSVGAVADEVIAESDLPEAEIEPVLVAPTRDGGGRYEFEEGVAVRIALDNRLDFRRAEGEVIDAQRDVVVAADGLRAELTIGGSASVGQRRPSIFDANEGDSRSLRLDQGSYSGFLTLDLPVERTAERLAYRASLIDFEREVRDLQQFEDVIKGEIRERLRTLLTSREQLRIQAAAVRLAERRVESTKLFLELGRAETRDLLESEEDLLSAQNAFTSALVSYRIAELEIQRDMGVLEFRGEGVVAEFDPVGAPALAGSGRGVRTGADVANRRGGLAVGGGAGDGGAGETVGTVGSSEAM